MLLGVTIAPFFVCFFRTITILTVPLLLILLVTDSKGVTVSFYPQFTNSSIFAKIEILSNQNVQTQKIAMLIGT